VDRQTRKDLKTDKFALEVTHTFEFLTHHTAEVKRYGAIGLVAVALVAGIFYYTRYQTGARQEALSQALRIDDASVGTAKNPNSPAGALNYATQEEKEKARAKAFSDLVAKYHGTQEGAIAQMYLASDTAEKGNLAEAEKRYKDVVDTAPGPYASLARLSLAKVYESEGKNSEAEKVLRKAVANPSITVSKEQATIQLALFIGKTNPAEARKMLEPLRTERMAVSRAAVQAMGEIPQQ
jgi:predicted negative regulator of RcsB-dependent stress response